MAISVPIIGPLFNAISTLGGTWLEGRNAKMKVKAESEAKVMVMASQSVADWEAIQAKNSGTSLKDEWLTALFSVPLVMSFIPGAVPYVNEGFVVLETMPAWYQYTLSVIVAASFGVNKAIGWNKSRAVK
mgnify:CR=1 FL=1